VLNVQRTIKQLIASGAKGCVIEDEEWPKRPGQLRNKNVLAMEEVGVR
jgi:2-methylisocitrate lyase-like PEP mutase family enzyme